MSEVLSWHGNRRIELKEDWADKMELAFLSWLLKRAELINGTVTIPSPYKMPITEKIGVPGKATIHFLTLTVYPDPDPETTSVDGDLNVDDITNSTSWATIIAQASSDYALVSDTQCNFWRAENLGRRVCGRVVTLFDTSALTASATISAATISMYIQAAGGDTSHSVNANVYTSNPASNTALVTGDYNRSTKWGSTPLCDTDVNNSTTKGQYADWALNATGLAAISKTAVTKLGFRTGHDINGTDPTARSYWPVYMADQTGTSTDPKLVITYTTNTAFTATVTETVTLTDQKTVATTFLLTVSQTVTLSDAVTTVASFGERYTVTVTEQVNLSDAVTSQKTFSVTISEQITLDDLVTYEPIWTFLSKTVGTWTMQSKTNGSWTFINKGEL